MGPAPPAPSSQPQEASKPLGHQDLLVARPAGPTSPRCFSLGLKTQVLTLAPAPAGPAGKRDKLPPKW